MIRADLGRARARWIRETPDRKERRKRRASEFLAIEDASGHVAEFHSLRVSFITLLVKGGVSVKIAQEFARHSTPPLTPGVYTKLGVHNLTGALGALPNLAPTPAAELQRVAMQARRRISTREARCKSAGNRSAKRRRRGQPAASLPAPRPHRARRASP